MKVFFTSTYLDLIKRRKAALLRGSALLALIFSLLTSCATPTPTITPAPSLSPTPTATPKPTETPTPTSTATPTEVPLPSQFLAQAREHGFSYEVVDGKVMLNSTDGKSVEIDPNQMTDWPILENNYLVIKGDNGIPQLRYVEGKGWESVEQTSKIDAFGNTVPGWVVETSPVWDGVPPYFGDLNTYVLIAQPSSPSFR